MSTHSALQHIFGDRIKKQEILARYTTFKIGGPADFFFEAKTEEELTQAVQAARSDSMPVYIFGGGTNALIGDKGIRGLVIKNSTDRISIRGMKGAYRAGMPNGLVYVEASSGVIMNKLVRFTIEEGLAGLEMQLGLPGTVGGAMYMNSKWTHPEGYVGDVVYQATILTQKNALKVVPQSYFRFGYDMSIVQKTKDIVIHVVFALKQADKDVLWQTANESIAYRRETQPQGVFTLGCTFRNIPRAQAIALATPDHTTSAGFLIDHAGLKGVSVGDAQISDVHANFIVNRGHATASDVVQLIEMARTQVKKKFGVELEEEIVRVGEF